MRTKKIQPALTGAQLRAARGLLGISAEELADETKVSLRTIRRAEQNNGLVQITAANAARIMSVLEAKGVRFTPADDTGGVGVRLSDAHSPTHLVKD